MNREENEALWSSIREEYLRSELSLRKLAEKYGVSRGTLQRRCAREGWAAQRRQPPVGNTAQRLEETAQMLLTLLQADFADRQQFHRYLVKTKGADELEERVFGKIDTKALKEVTAALKDLKAMLEREEDPEGGLRVVFEAGEEEWNE